MAGQLAVVTGATSGIGLFVAKGLVRAGYKVVIIARNAAKATEILPLIQSAGGSQVAVELADLASLASIEKLAEQIGTKYPEVSLLVNNAGVMVDKKILSQDGIELDLAINHLAPFLLSWRLLPYLQNQPGARVVNVNSQVHETATLQLSDFEEAAPFKMMGSYAKSKLANMLTTVEFARRVPAEKVTFNSVHPGVVGTNLGANGTGLITATAWKLMKPFALKPEVGAQTVLWAATAPELKAVSGHYYKKQALATPSPLVQDQTLREQVWQRTLALVKLPQAEWATF